MGQGNEVRHPLPHGLGHPPGVVLIAVNEDRQTLHGLHDLQRALQRELGLRQILSAPHVEDRRSVDRDGIAEKGQGADGLRDAVKEAARGGHDLDAGSRRAGQGFAAAVREPLFGIEQGAVQIKGDQADLTRLLISVHGGSSLSFYIERKIREPPDALRGS